MAASTERTLLIADGGLPSLVAGAMCADPEHLTLWLPQSGAFTPEGPIGVVHRRAVEDQSELLGAGELVICTLPALPVTDLAETAKDGGMAARLFGLGTTRILLEACEEAVRRHCWRVIWPVVGGGSVTEMFAAAEQADLITRLVRLGGMAGAGPKDGPDLRIELPLVDLTTDQVADLALDLDVPVESCWWAREEAGEMAPAVRSRLEWEAVLGNARRVRGMVTASSPA